MKIKLHYNGIQVERWIDITKKVASEVKMVMKHIFFLNVLIIQYFNNNQHSENTMQITDLLSNVNCVIYYNKVLAKMQRSNLLIFNWLLQWL